MVVVVVRCVTKSNADMFQSRLGTASQLSNFARVSFCEPPFCRDDHEGRAREDELLLKMP
jgi:hypothetical protein